MLFMLNSLHFFVSHSLFSQSQSGFYLCSITLSTPAQDTNELCVPKTHFALFFFKPTALGIPRRSSIQVRTSPDPA